MDRRGVVALLLVVGALASGDPQSSIPAVAASVAAPGTTTALRTGASSDPARAGSGDKCDPNYSGACVPVAKDVDCAGGSGNGPAYVRGPVRVIGKDVYGLDRDGNGTGCET